jgi:hypothetical protein
MGISKAKTMTELWYEYLNKLGFNIGGIKWVIIELVY